MPLHRPEAGGATPQGATRLRLPRSRPAIEDPAIDALRVHLHDARMFDSSGPIVDSGKGEATRQGASRRRCRGERRRIGATHPGTRTGGREHRGSKPRPLPVASVVFAASVFGLVSAGPPHRAMVRHRSVRGGSYCAIAGSPADPARRGALRRQLERSPSPRRFLRPRTSMAA